MTLGVNISVAQDIGGKFLIVGTSPFSVIMFCCFMMSCNIPVNRLKNSFQKFYGRYPDLVSKYQKSVRDILNDLFPF